LSSFKFVIPRSNATRNLLSSPPFRDPAIHPRLKAQVVQRVLSHDTKEVRTKMSTLGLIEYKDASPEVRSIYDDIMATRKTDWINNFWKAIAHDPATLKRTWEDIKQIMAPGALDPLTKELIYVAVSVTNQCHYCIASHTVSAQKKGMTDAMFKELMAVVGMANETNKMVTGYQVEIDPQFKK
jgi:AhpD family alkylhydroperoxidase